MSPILQVKDGQVCLGYDLGHGNISGCVPFSINDGNWYKVGASFSPAVNLGKQLTVLSLFPYLQFSYWTLAEVFLTINHPEAPSAQTFLQDQQI